jgi:hypothetical protein
MSVRRSLQVLTLLRQRYTASYDASKPQDPNTKPEPTEFFCRLLPDTWVTMQPQFMPKYVDLTVLSATFVCSIQLYTSEKAVPTNQYLLRSHISRQ